MLNFLAECSFCGFPEDKVRFLIVGPGVSICDGCVMLCYETLWKEGVLNVGFDSKKER